eukprot:SAG11_NODE_18817_length_480_cov_1.850394_1_plen_49_part_00
MVGVSKMLWVRFIRYTVTDWDGQSAFTPPENAIETSSSSDEEDLNAMD